METIKVYKLFRQDEALGTLHPLFIDGGLCLPMNQWITARNPSEEVIKEVPTGFALIDMVRQGIIEVQVKRPTREQVKRGQLRFCRWVERRDNGHLYDIGIGSDGQVLRFAHRPGWHSSATPSLPAVDMTGKVWAECLIPSDDYYTLHRNLNGLSKEHGAIDWFISQRIMITKVMDATQ